MCNHSKLQLGQGHISYSLFHLDDLHKFIRCCLLFQLSQLMVVIEQFQLLWRQWPTCIMTSRTRAGVKILLSPIENVWGIDTPPDKNVCNL